MKQNNTQRLSSYNSYSGCDMIASARVSSHDGLKNNIYTLGSLQTISISTHQDKNPVRAISNINAKDYTMGQRTIAGSLVFAVFDKHFADQMFKDSIDAAKTGNGTIMLPDELPPFDITISYANEYGHTSRMAIYGVRLIEEGLVMSINDIYTENTYRFVATGIEPLNKDQDVGSIQRNNHINMIVGNDKDNSNSRIVVDEIIDNLTKGIQFNRKNAIQLSVETEYATSNEDLGIAKFYLAPHQTTGRIKVYGNYNTEEIILNLVEYINTKVYYTYLPTGNYYAIYEDTDKTSNTATFKIESLYETRNATQDIPVIEEVTNNGSIIATNDKTHDTAVIRPITKVRADSVEQKTSIKSKKATFTNLEPNTEYEIYTYNSTVPGDPSMKTTFSTLKHKTEVLDNFKEYVSFNSSILTYNDTELYTNMLDEAKFENNIVDLILNIKPDENQKDYQKLNEMKQELLFYAIKFQNYITSDLNKRNEIAQPYKDIKYSFYDTLIFSNKSTHSHYFRKEKNKFIFDSKVDTHNTNTFTGYNNKRYYCYSTDELGTRGPRYDFCNFTFDDKNMLEKYSNTNILAEQDKEFINNLYNKNITKTNLERLSAEYYKKPEIKLLIKPMVTLVDNLDIVINNNYSDIFEPNTEVYITFAQANESLDVTPFKKIKTVLSDEIIISSIESGIKYNDSYLVWIENMDQTIISFAESFNTYVNNHSLILEDDEIKYKDIEKEINYILAKLSDKTTISTELKEIIQGVNDDTETHQNNIFDKIIFNIMSNKTIFKDVHTLLSYLIFIKHNKEYFINADVSDKILYNRNENTVEFLSNNLIDISYTHIDEYDGTTNKKVISNNKIKLDSNMGYTLLFAISKNKIIKSGFILIDNKTKDYIYNNIKVEVI